MIPIEITLVGIVTDVSCVHPVKAWSMMDVYCVGIVTDPDGQLIQTAYVVTDDGMIDVVSAVPLKANAPNDNGDIEIGININ